MGSQVAKDAKREKRLLILISLSVFELSRRDVFIRKHCKKQSDVSHLTENSVATAISRVVVGRRLVKFCVVAVLHRRPSKAAAIFPRDEFSSSHCVIFHWGFECMSSTCKRENAFITGIALINTTISCGRRCEIV